MIRPRELSRSVAMFAAKTPTLPPATHTNSYAIGVREVVLIEPATPYEDEQRAWIAWARSLPSQGRAPIAILATHHHPDHVGGIDVLARELALPLWMHGETASRVALAEPPARLLEDDERVVLEGPVPSRWRVLHTPGHAPGHVCLFDEDERAVVVGDMVASQGTILIAPGDGDMKVYLDQLERLARLDARVALPAHGEPIDAPTAIFRKYVAHRLMREEKIRKTVEAHGPLAPDAIVPIAYDDTPVAAWPFALLSVRAHLDKLVADGRVEAREGRYAVRR